MVRRTTAAVAAALVAVLGGTLAAPATAVDHGAGYSPTVTREDSYYPAHGDPGVDVLSYDLDLRWASASHTLAGTATLRLRAVTSASAFRLDLGAPLAVSALTVDGAPAPFSHPGNVLSVQSPVAAGATYDVVVTYAGKPAPTKAPSTRSDMKEGLGWHTTSDGRAYALQEPFGAFTWYPVNDMPADKALFTVRLDVPGRWTGVSNGTMTSRSTADGRTVTTFSNQHPIAPYLTTVAIGPYSRYQQTGPHGLPIVTWYPTGHRELTAPMRHLGDDLRWLEHTLGRYPFEQAGVVIVPSSDSAMETQTMVTLGRRLYDSGNRNVRETVAHELAHAWYGDTVTPTDWRDLWMNEGFAMYVQARFSVHMGWSTWARWVQVFTSWDSYLRSEYGPPGRWDRRAFAETNVYYCPALMLVRLQKRIGRTAVASALKAWPQEHLDSNRSRSGYVHWLEKRTGKELSAFFRTELDDVRPRS